MSFTQRIDSARARWIVFAALALMFYVVALSNEVYNLTSPVAWNWHVLLRKAYSVVAFIIIGIAYLRAASASLTQAALVVAAYSGLIEIGQHIENDGREPLYWNAVDIVCGGVGGALASLIRRIRAR